MMEAHTAENTVSSKQKKLKSANLENFAKTFLLHVFVQSKICNVSGTFLLVRAVLAVVGEDMTALGILPPETESEANAC
jgi:hypothetical protein